MSSYSTASRELDLINTLLAERSEGMRASVLEAAMAARNHAMPRRTLLRRLETLLTTHRIVRIGEGRSTTYRQSHAPIRATANLSAPMGQLHATGGAYVPLSTAGLEVRDAVRHPPSQRQPAGYDKTFLESYRPDLDHYLLPTQREQLHTSGRTAPDARPAGTHARDILSRLLIDLSWASSRLEGNTYSLLDTLRLVELGQSAAGSSVQDTQMILNHIAAIEMVVDNADEVGFNRYTILNLHAILSENLLSDPRSIGRLRTRAVAISGSIFQPLTIPQQIEECFAMVLDKAARITDPFEQAFFGMVHLPYLQPFEDLNKRVSRLAANIPLIRHNLCPLSFVDVPAQAYIEATVGVYELRRIELLRDVFVWAYERSCQRYLSIRQSIGEPDAFRLKYREPLGEVVRSVVRGALRGQPAEIVQLAQTSVPSNDMQPFIDMVHTDLDHLYEGNIARYRLRPSEYAAWPFKRDRA